MKRAEIDRKFDEIVAVAEIEKFIDTPVKHYSRGYIRLGFTGAAHRSAERSRRSLEPEILLVDEALAAEGWGCRNDTGERRRIYGRLKRESCGETGILARV